MRDCADVLDVIARPDVRDSTSVKSPVDGYAKDLERGVNGLRLGLPREYLVDGIEPGVRNAFESAASELEALGAPRGGNFVTAHRLRLWRCTTSSLPQRPRLTWPGTTDSSMGIRRSDASNSREVMDRTRGRGFGAEVKRRILLGAYALSAGYYDAYYKKAQQVRTLILREFPRSIQ